MSSRTVAANASSGGKTVPSSLSPEGKPDRVRAICTILAGVNGSGKSSIYDVLKPPGRFINVDVVERHLAPSNPERASFAAGKLVLHELATMLQTQQDFVYETTLSSAQSIELIRSALDADYEVGLIFVMLRDEELHGATGFGWRAHYRFRRQLYP